MADTNRNLGTSDDLNRADSPSAREAEAILGAGEPRAARGPLAGDARTDEGDVVGETVGSVSGIAAGAAIGSLAGPIGTVVGALAGAVGGWWAGRAVTEAAGAYTDEDDAYFRRHFERTRRDDTVAGDYDRYRPAYQIGHVASRNPDYAERNFDDVEPDLRRAWTSDVGARHGAWDSARDRVRAGFERGRDQRLTVADQPRDFGRTTAPADTVAGAAAYEADRAGNAVERGARKVGDTLDDLKDRVDGDPASRPGPDPTDNPNRL